MSARPVDSDGSRAEPVTLEAGIASDALGRLTLFGRTLRGEGVAVGTGRIATFCRAAALLSPDDLYWAGRATLVARWHDIPVYDRVFREFFGPPPQRDGRARSRVHIEGAIAEQARGLASPVELLREKNFARCSPEELAQLAELMGRVHLAVPLRRSRRLRPARTGAPDLRRTLRRSFRTGGEPLERAWRSRRTRPRRLVLLLDVSGSMAEYSRAGRSWSSARTAWRSATPSSWPSRWHGCTGSPTGSSGSTRSRRIRPTSRSPAGCRPLSATL